MQGESAKSVLTVLPWKAGNHVEIRKLGMEYLFTSWPDTGVKLLSSISEKTNTRE